MVSQLILDFTQTNDVRTLRVNDSSFYNPSIDVECGTLQVTAPGYIEPVIFNVAEGFSLVLNSSNLKMTKVKVYRDLGPLVDGIYTFKYSIKPNESLWVEYDHLRIENILKSYNEALCRVKLQSCPSTKQVHEELKRLREIKGYIDVAKAQVEVRHNRTKGLELYNYAKELLNINCKDC